MNLNSNQQVLMDFFQTRRSFPVKNLKGPPPDQMTLLNLLRAAVRVPDHGKLEPWRFIIYDTRALKNLSLKIKESGDLANVEPEKILKSQALCEKSPLMVAVIFSPKSSERIPLVEQQLSSGAVCLSLVNVALASGWAATWLTGWMAHDRPLQEKVLGLNSDEFVAGFIHIGTAEEKPLERPRPNLENIVIWAE